MITIKSSHIAAMERRYRTTFINSLPGYKSLHLAGTISDDGVSNLGLFNSVFHLGANPPLLGMVLRPERPENDTLRNIKRCGQYTLNNVLPGWYKQAHQASAHYPQGVSEFDICGLKKLYADGFKAPFVAQSTIRLGLELRELIDVEFNNTTIVIGEIVEVLLNDALIDEDGYVDHLKAQTITVAGLDSYFTTNPVGRLSYAKPGTQPQDLATSINL